MKPGSDRLGIWAGAKYGQYATYSMLFVQVLLDALGQPSLITARFSGVHHSLIILGLILFGLYARLKTPGTVAGFLRSVMWVVFAAGLAETGYNSLFIPFHLISGDASAFYADMFINGSVWVIVMFAGLLFGRLWKHTDLFEATNWISIWVIFHALWGFGLMSQGITFHASVCTCNYRLAYYADPLTNGLEIFENWLFFLGLAFWIREKKN